MARRRLVGGLGRWRARWTLWRLGLPFAAFPPGPLDGLEVDATGQPALFRLIDEVAARVGPSPQRVVVTSDAQWRGSDGPSGRVLVLGLPLLLRLSTEELSALVAHELAQFGVPFPRLTARIRQSREEASVLASSRSAPLGRRVVPRCETFLRHTARFADALEERADAAATDVGGDAVAARALAKAAVIATDFGYLLWDLDTKLQESGLDVGIADVHEAWLTRLRWGRTGPFPPEPPGGAHPPLADLIRLVPLDDLDPAATTSPVSLAGFTDTERQTILAPAGYGAPARWIATSEVPSEVWRAAAERDADDVRDRVAKLLGRAPDSVGEAIDVLATRYADVAAVDFSGEPAEPADLRRASEDALTALVEGELVALGWRRVHPCVEGLLRGPDGADVDLLPTARRAAADPAARAELAAMVTPAPPGPG